MADIKKIEQMFVEHAGRIRNDVSRVIQTSDFYIQHLNKTPFLDGQGQIYQYPIYERVLPSQDVEFRLATSSGGNGIVGVAPEGEPMGSANLPGVDIVSFGVQTRTVQLREQAINSPDISLKDLRYIWQLEDQLKNVQRVLAEITKYVWAKEYQDAYVESCGNKLVLNDSVEDQIGNATFDTAVPTQPLSWDLLEFIYENLGYEGAEDGSFGVDDEGNPIYALVGDRHDFNRLKLLDDNFRADQRGFYEGAQMLNGAPGMPTGKSYRGYAFRAVKHPPRYDFVDGQLVRRMPYIGVQDTSFGLAFRPNPLYASAKYSVTTVYHKSVLDIVVPGIQATGAMAFNPQYSWTGEFTWRNIPDRDRNVDGNIGFFRALYAYGRKPQLTERGYAILHERCRVIPKAKSCAEPYPADL
jgi:hypothetical protein